MKKYRDYEQLSDVEEACNEIKKEAMKTITFQDILKKWMEKESFRKLRKERKFKYFILTAIANEYTKRKLTITELVKMSDLSYNTVYNALMLCDCKLSTVSKLVNALGLEFNLKE